MTIGEIYDALRELNELEAQIMVLELEIVDEKSRKGWTDMMEKELKDKQALLGYFRNRRVDG